MSSDSILLSRISYRHSRVGNLPYIVYFSGCLATLACSLLIAGAIMMAIVFTEVRPPTDDENYQRYIGADFRRVIGKHRQADHSDIVVLPYSSDELRAKRL